MRWMHLSDLHLNRNNDGVGTTFLRADLLKYLEEQKLQVHELFITGDFRDANSCDDTDEVAADVVAHIKQISTAIGINDVSHIHIVPGNHDLTRDATDVNAARLQSIRKNYSPDKGQFDDETKGYLAARFGFFNRVVKHLYGDTPSVWDKGLIPLHKSSCKDDYNILYLNTAITSGEDNERGKLVLGTQDLLKALNECKNDNPTFVLAHHSTLLLSENEKHYIAKLFECGKILVYLCGDAHNSWCEKIDDTFVEITAGCMKVDNGVQETFSIGQFDETTHKITGITAHWWDRRTSRWGEYSQMTERIEEQLNIKKRQHNFRSVGKVFGQDKLIADIIEALKTHNTVEVNGFPGMGKTTVCLKALDNMNADYLVVDLSGITNYAAALTKILVTFGERAKDNIELSEQVNNALSNAVNIVLYFDNLEDPLCDEAFKSWFTDIVENHKGTILYSKRGNKTNITDSPILRARKLDIDNTIKLFERHWGDSVPKDELEGLKELLAAMDCHPLSVVLAARQREFYPTIKELREQWENDKTHVTMEIGGSKRNRSLYASLTMSYNVLKENHMALVLWGVLAYLPGAVPHKLIAAVFSKEPIKLDPAARLLIETGLLSKKCSDDGNDSLYQMLAPIKDMANEFLTSELRQQAKALIRDTFVEVYTLASDRHSDDRLLAHGFAVDCIEYALGYLSTTLLDKGNNEQLIIQMQNYYQFSNTLAYALLDKLRNLVAPSPKKQTLAIIYHQMGEIERLCGDIYAAMSHLEKAEELFRLIGYNVGLANVLLSIGVINLLRGHADIARKSFEEAETILREENNSFGLANAVKGIGDVEYYCGNTDAARAKYSEAEVLFRSENNDVGRANVLNSLGEVELRCGNFDVAERAYRQAEELYKSLEDKLGLANVLKSMGDLALCRGEIDVAKEKYMHAEKLYREENYVLGLANVIYRKGDLARRSGDNDLATAYYEDAKDRYVSIGQPTGLAVCYGELCRAYAIKNDIEKTLHYEQLAIEVCERVPDDDKNYVNNCIENAHQILEQLSK